jgi:hypothetical protein
LGAPDERTELSLAISISSERAHALLTNKTKSGIASHDIGFWHGSGMQFPKDTRLNVALDAGNRAPNRLECRSKDGNIQHGSNMY